MNTKYALLSVSFKNELEKLVDYADQLLSNAHALDVAGEAGWSWFISYRLDHLINGVSVWDYLPEGNPKEYLVNSGGVPPLLADELLTYTNQLVRDKLVHYGIDLTAREVLEWDATGNFSEDLNVIVTTSTPIHPAKFQHRDGRRA